MSNQHKRRKLNEASVKRGDRWEMVLNATDPLDRDRHLREAAVASVASMLIRSSISKAFAIADRQVSVVDDDPTAVWGTEDDPRWATVARATGDTALHENSMYHGWDLSTDPLMVKSDAQA